MDNHYHLCLATPLGNLSVGMRWLQSTFASRFNRYRKENGHLFQGRFKSIVVEPGRHWLDLVDYIHLNPIKAGLVDLGALGKCPWTNLYWFPKRKTRPAYLDCSWMVYFDELQDSAGGWRRYATHLRLKMTDDPAEIEALDKRMCQGWCLGDAMFRKALAEDFSKDKNTVRLEREDLAKLNRDLWSANLERCLKTVGKREPDIANDKFSSSWKLAIAFKLKRDTSATNAWVAEALNMGTPKGVSSFCGKYAKERQAHCEYSKSLSELTIVH